MRILKVEYKCFFYSNVTATKVMYYNSVSQQVLDSDLGKKSLKFTKDEKFVNGLFSTVKSFPE